MSAEKVPGVCRLLLRAYPSGPRRAEIWGTLTESWADRTRPASLVALGLLRHGLRARLGRPKSTAVVVAAVLISMITGFLGGAAADGIAWAATKAPAENTLAGAIFPGQTVRDVRDVGAIRSQGWKSYLTGGDDEDSFGAQNLGALQPPGTDPAEWLAQARDRVTAAGWRYRGPGGPENDQSFWATRGGYAVEVGVSSSTPPGEALDPHVEIVRTQPWWLTAVALAGGIAGMLGGWLLVGWVSRRTERSPRLFRGGITVLTSIIVAFMLPHVLLGAYLFGSKAAGLLPPTVAGPPWISLFKVYGWLLFVTSIGLMTLIVGIAWRTTEDPQIPAPQ